MQFPARTLPPVGLVFDSDLGDGIDGVLALALLHALDNANEARLISTSTSKSLLRSAALADVLARFFAGSPPQAGGREFLGFQRPFPPIGMAANGRLGEDTTILRAVLDKTTPDGAPVYPRGAFKLTDTADPATLIRNALTAQADGNAVVVLAGPASNIVAMLDLPGVPALIKDKVKCLVIAAGTYPQGEPDPRILADMPSAKLLFAEWPTPVVATGVEVGEGLPFPGAAVEGAMAWTPDHPVVDAYRAYRRMPYDASSPSAAAVAYAVHPEGWFQLSSPGAIEVLGDGRTRFTPSEKGRHRFLVIDPAQKQKIAASYVKLAAAKPVVRPGRRRSTPQQEALPGIQPKAPDAPL